ncbi:GNAT family N-acetyltransferase (plasmid) [Rhodobacteraceae bacterium S2214]|nr:GNAT family N-acetyltransferase [Rhodobacteraceae bacterium S2214]
MLTRQDYNEVAQLHINSIDQGFLSTLGERFLALLYRSIDETPQAVLIVERCEGEIIGFVSGGQGMKAIYKTMLRHFPSLAWSLAPALLSPAKIWRILEILRQKPASLSSERPAWELFSIAVIPKVRGTGAAQDLYANFRQALLEQAVDRFAIVVGENLAPANRFYYHMGAKPAGEIFVHGDSKSIVYVDHTQVGS